MRRPRDHVPFVGCTLRIPETRWTAVASSRKELDVTEDWTSEIEAGSSATLSLIGDDELVLTDAFEVASPTEVGSEVVSRMAIAADNARRAAAERSISGPSEVSAHRSVVDHALAPLGQDRWLVSVVIVFELRLVPQ